MKTFSVAARVWKGQRGRVADGAFAYDGRQFKVMQAKEPTVTFTLEQQARADLAERMLLDVTLAGLAAGKFPELVAAARRFVAAANAAGV